MNLNPLCRDWFFPIEEAPVLATITHKGVARNVTVPHRKALVAADTGHIVGIVGAGYKVFTNQQAVTLCHKRPGYVEEIYAWQASPKTRRFSASRRCRCCRLPGAAARVRRVLFLRIVFMVR